MKELNNSVQEASINCKELQEPIWMDKLTANKGNNNMVNANYWNLFVLLAVSIAKQLLSDISSC